MPTFKMVCVLPSVDCHIEMEADNWEEACGKVFDLSTNDLLAKSTLVEETDGRIIPTPSVSSAD